MKKLATLFIAILFALSMTGLSYAQAPAAPGPSPDKDAMSSGKPTLTPEEQKKLDEKRAEKKAKKAEKKKAKKAEKAKKREQLKEQWKKEREAPKPPVESGVPK